MFRTVWGAGWARDHVAIKRCGTVSRHHSPHRTPHVTRHPFQIFCNDHCACGANSNCAYRLLYAFTSAGAQYVHSSLLQVLVALLIEQRLSLCMRSRHHLLVRHIRRAPQIRILLPIGRTVLEALGHSERLDTPAARRFVLVECSTRRRSPDLPRRHVDPTRLELRATLREVSLQRESTRKADDSTLIQRQHAMAMKASRVRCASAEIDHART